MSDFGALNFPRIAAFDAPLKPERFLMAERDFRDLVTWGEEEEDGE